MHKLIILVGFFLELQNEENGMQESDFFLVAQQQGKKLQLINNQNVSKNNADLLQPQKRFQNSLVLSCASETK